MPELPEAVASTVTRALEEREIRSRLEGTWEYLPRPSEGEAGPPVRLTISFTGSGSDLAGEFFSPAIRQWTPWDTAFLDGRREGRFLHVRVFEFVGGQRTTKAELLIRFQEEPQELSDHLPELVLNELEVEVKTEAKPALPRAFTLRRVGSK